MINKHKQNPHARREYLINELLRLDEETYIEMPIYSMKLAELENLHIAEKCKTKHQIAYLNRTVSDAR